MTTDLPLDQFFLKLLDALCTFAPRPMLPAQTGGGVFFRSGRTTGPFHPLGGDWGARVTCYALVSAGLRDASRLHRAASNLQHANGTEAAWWLGLMTRSNGKRAIRALRILVEAVR